MIETVLAQLPAWPTFAVTFFVVALGGFLRGFTGFGGALVIIPVVALFYDPQTAVVFHALIEIPGMLQLMPDGLRTCNRSTVLPMLLALIVAVPAGMYFLVAIDPDIMRIAMSVAVLAMVALMSTGWQYKDTVGASVSMAGGAVGGFLQGAVGIGGPPIVTLLMSRHDEHATTRGNILIMMGSLLLTALPAQFFYGLFHQQVVIISIVMAPFYMLSAYLGSRTFRASGGKHYRKGAMTLLAATAVATLLGSLL